MLSNKHNCDLEQKNQSFSVFTAFFKITQALLIK